MQYNPGQQTIEAALMKAMSEAGGVSSENAGHFTKVAQHQLLLSISTCVTTRMNTAYTLY